MRLSTAVLDSSALEMNHSEIEIENEKVHDADTSIDQADLTLAKVGAAQYSDDGSVTLPYDDTLAWVRMRTTIGQMQGHPETKSTDDTVDHGDDGRPFSPSRNNGPSKREPVLSAIFGSSFMDKLSTLRHSMCRASSFSAARHAIDFLLIYVRGEPGMLRVDRDIGSTLTFCQLISAAHKLCPAKIEDAHHSVSALISQQSISSQEVITYATANMCMATQHSMTGERQRAVSPKRSEEKCFEGPHPYLPNMDTRKEISFPGCHSIEIYFDAQTETEQGCDFVFFTVGDSGKVVGQQFSGESGWPSKRAPRCISGNKCHVHFKSDGSNEKWGWRLHATGVSSVMRDPDELVDILRQNARQNQSGHQFLLPPTVDLSCRLYRIYAGTADSGFSHTAILALHMALEHTRQVGENGKSVQILHAFAALLQRLSARSISHRGYQRLQRVKTLLLQILFPKGGSGDVPLEARKDGKLKAAACEAAVALAPLLQESEQKPNLLRQRTFGDEGPTKDDVDFVTLTFHEESPSSGMDVDAKGKKWREKALHSLDKLAEGARNIRALASGNAPESILRKTFLTMLAAEEKCDFRNHMRGHTPAPNAASQSLPPWLYRTGNVTTVFKGTSESGQFQILRPNFPELSGFAYLGDSLSLTSDFEDTIYMVRADDSRFKAPVRLQYLCSLKEADIWIPIAPKGFIPFGFVSTRKDAPRKELLVWLRCVPVSLAVFESADRISAPSRLRLHAHCERREELPRTVFEELFSPYIDVQAAEMQGASDVSEISIVDVTMSSNSGRSGDVTSEGGEVDPITLDARQCSFPYISERTEICGSGMV